MQQQDTIHSQRERERLGGREAERANADNKHDLPSPFSSHLLQPVTLPPQRQQEFDRLWDGEARFLSALAHSLAVLYPPSTPSAARSTQLEDIGERQHQGRAATEEELAKALDGLEIPKNAV
jgi:hypothetical protein